MAVLLSQKVNEKIPVIDPKAGKYVSANLVAINVIVHSGAPAAPKRSTITAKTEPHACIGIETHATLFFMANVASSMDRGRARPTTTDCVVQHGGHTPANARYLFTAYVFNI